MQRRRDQPPRGGEGVVIDLERWPLARGGGHHAAGDPAERGDRQHGDAGALHRDPAGGDGAEEDGEIGSRLHQTGAAQHVVGAQMLGQDGVFDRPEKGGMDTQRQHRAKHQREPGTGIARLRDEQPGGTHGHDRDLRGLHQTDDARLVMAVRQLPGEGGEQHERHDRQAGGQRVEIGFLMRVVEDRVGGEQHHRRLEQIVVEGAEELGDEQRQEAPPRKEPEGIEHNER